MSLIAGGVASGLIAASLQQESGLLFAAAELVLLYYLNLDRMTWVVSDASYFVSVVYGLGALASFTLLVTSAEMGSNQIPAWIYMVSSAGYALFAGRPEFESCYISGSYYIQILFLLVSVGATIANASVQSGTPLWIGLAAAILSFLTDGIYTVAQLIKQLERSSDYYKQVIYNPLFNPWLL